jgi:hypothetical protein
MWSPLLAAALLAMPEPAEIALPVRTATAEAAALPGAQADVLALEGALPARCGLTRAELPGPISSSGRVAVHLFGREAGGRACDGWAWAQVRLRAPVLVTTRPVAEGDLLEGAVAMREREVLPGRPPLSTLPEGAAAARALAAGVAVDEALIRIGARPGEAVAVVLRAGALSVEQQGRAVACRRGRVCALLPSGRRVEGVWHEGRIVLGSP